MAPLSALLRQLHQDPNTRGLQFEQICGWFLSNAPAYRHDLRRVWLWDEWPGRWGADAGIDLVAEDRQGRLWAIQAKAYAEAGTVTKADVDSFLSESNRPEFSFRLLIATTNRLAPNARKVIDGQEKPVGVVLRGDLERAEVSWPASPDDLRAAPVEPKLPLVHQAEAIEAVVTGFDASNRGQLVMACGTGKTLASLFIAERLKATRTLVLLPSLSLLAQTLREWTANASGDFEFLPVCSDETVADRDGMVASTAELGLPVTTAADEVARFLRARGPRVIFATYQSSPRIAEAYRQGRVPRLDLVVADEAHRCAGRVSGDFATVLDSDAIRARRRLFMTATPRYFTGRIIRAAREADLEVASMDDEATFGPVFHRLTFGEAIERDLLSNYQVAIIGVDDSTYRSWAEHGRLVTIDGDNVTDARTLAGQIGVAKAMARYDLRRTISFHSRVAAARRFANTLPEIIDWMPPPQRPDGDLWTDHVSGQMSTGERDTRLGHLRQLEAGQRGLLANARCLAEGVDVPTLDGVAFIDPRRSEVDIVQAVGRAIRKAPDKTLGTIVLPVFIGNTHDPESVLDDSAFKPIWDVIKALRAHDDDLAEQLDELRRQLGRGGAATLPDNIHVDFPAGVDGDFASAFAPRLIEAVTATWEFGFGVLTKFVDREGHASVEQFHDEGGFPLGRWVSDQRERYRLAALRADRAARLDRLPKWSWDAQETRWEDGFDALCEFIAHSGDARVPTGLVTDRGFALGQWVSVQRTRFRRGQLTTARSERLEDLPGWAWSTYRAAWEKGFAALEEYLRHEAHTRVPDRYRAPDGYGLGVWTRTQRSAYGQGKLPAEQAARLEALPGWTWTVLEVQWDEGFASLAAYVRHHATAQVPLRFVDSGGFRLGQWVSGQRRAFKKGQVPSDRVARLEALPGWTWDPLADRWRLALTALRAFVGREGHARVPSRHVEGDSRLGEWVVHQRAEYRRGVLEPERVAALEAVPGWLWSGVDAAWEDAFAALVEFAATEGHAQVPTGYRTSDGRRLGDWVINQRQAHRRGELRDDRVSRLESLPGWLWNARSR